MRCTEAAHQLQLYIDNRLTLKQTRALEAHIVGCAACQEELALLQQVTSMMNDLNCVAEPEDLNARIMQRVAITPQRRRAPQYSLLRPSLAELLAVVLLATITTLGSILQQPALRALLPIANGHDPLSIAFMHILHTLLSLDSGTLTLALWVIGTILGIFITLVLAGNEIRSQWFKAMMERLPVR
jgi:hypothetical protein